MNLCYIYLRSQVIIAQEEDMTMTTTLTEQPIPTGKWTLDPVHSQVGFAVRHMGVSLFKGETPMCLTAKPTCECTGSSVHFPVGIGCSVSVVVIVMSSSCAMITCDRK